jgi:transcriptional regulator with XRE-family HTH domain
MEKRLARQTHALEARPSQLLTFRGWLEREYLRRRERNPSYSIRAFSAYLNLAPATVSQLLSGKRKPSAKFVRKLLLRLEATPEEQTSILLSIDKKALAVAAVPLRQEAYPIIASEVFRLIADWWHYAILELSATVDFKSEPAWIANRLGISVIETQQAIDRLMSLELMEKKNGKLVRTETFVTNYEEGMTSAALKQLQRHVIGKALAAVDETPSEEKDITSMTMAIDEKKLPQAKEMIKKFRRELSQFMETGKQTRVYNLGVQLYPVSKKARKEELK